MKELEVTVAATTGEFELEDRMEAAYKCIDAARDTIAREHAMRQPLTAEVCERLGMVKRATDYYVTQCRMIRADIPRGTIEGYVWGLSLTVGHLFAAATLAGVELDWRRVGQ